MKNKRLSTFEREMQDEVFRQQFEEEYETFLLSEVIGKLMKEDKKTVRQLAKETHLSPTVIQKLRSGKQEDVKLSNFINLSHACGFEIILEKGGHRIPL